MHVRSVCMGGIVQETGMKLTHSTQAFELLPFRLQVLVSVSSIYSIPCMLVVYLCMYIYRRPSYLSSIRL